jgi:hypothetical protein
VRHEITYIFDKSDEKGRKQKIITGLKEENKKCFEGWVLRGLRVRG